MKKKNRPRVVNGTIDREKDRPADEPTVAQLRLHFRHYMDEAQPLQYRTREIALEQMKIAFRVAQKEIAAAFPGVPFETIQELALIPPDDLNNAAKAIAAIRQSGREPSRVLVDPIRMRLIILE